MLSEFRAICGCSVKMQGPDLRHCASRRRARFNRGHQPLLLLLLVPAVLSVWWALSIPVPVGANTAEWGNFHPDESSHVAVFRFIAEHASLPPYRIPYDTSVHPPLYHLAAGLI